jgi:hypothetical protein
MESIAKAAALLLILSPFLALPVASQEDPLSPPAPPDQNLAPMPAPAAAPGSNSWKGCVDPQKGYQPVTIGEPTTICLVLSSSGDWSSGNDYLRLNFQPEADQYSRFHVPESFQQLVGGPDADMARLFPSNITVHVESQTALSFQRLYHDGDTKLYPFLTAIVTVNEGNVTGITWDDACIFCGLFQCEDITYGFDGQMVTADEAQQKVGGCPLTVDDCKGSDKAKCDLLLYVVWQGTDSTGREFASSSSRFSAFPQRAWANGLGDLELGMPDWMGNLNPFGEDEANDQTSN